MPAEQQTGDVDVTPNPVPGFDPTFPDRNELVEGPQLRHDVSLRDDLLPCVDLEPGDARKALSVAGGDAVTVCEGRCGDHEVLDRQLVSRSHERRVQRRQHARRALVESEDRDCLNEALRVRRPGSASRGRIRAMNTVEQLEDRYGRDETVGEGVESSQGGPNVCITALRRDEDARIDQRSHGETRDSAMARRSRTPASMSSAKSGSGVMLSNRRMRSAPVQTRTP